VDGSCAVRSRAVWRMEFEPVVSTGACADDGCGRQDLQRVLFQDFEDVGVLRARARVVLSGDVCNGR
jgi:hypothetical protein